MICRFVYSSCIKPPRFIRHMQEILQGQPFAPPPEVGGAYHGGNEYCSLCAGARPSSGRELLWLMFTCCCRVCCPIPLFTYWTFLVQTSSTICNFRKSPRRFGVTVVSPLPKKSACTAQSTLTDSRAFAHLPSSHAQLTGSGPGPTTSNSSYISWRARGHDVVVRVLTSQSKALHHRSIPLFCESKCLMCVCTLPIKQAYQSLPPRVAQAGASHAFADGTPVAENAHDPR